MSEQPKPDICECGNDMGHIAPGRRWEIQMAPEREFCSAQCARWAVALDAERALLQGTLDAERARADAAERSVQKLKRAMEYVIERASEITSDHHRDDCPVDYGCESCRLGDIVNDAMSDGEIVAAEKSCEDWQECAGHLALALKNQFHEESRTDEMREALAEFDRLAGEATKGVGL